MNFKQFGVSKNVMLSANAETKSNNGITISCDGKGKYHVEGKATEYTSITFNLEEFVIPVSVGAGGQGTFSMFNTESFTNNAVTFLFYNSNTRVDDWVLTTINRTNTVYNAMGNKTVTAIKFNITTGTECDFDISPMLTNDGQLPAEFEPHMIWHDIPHYIHNTSTDTITTLPAVLYANDTTATVGLKGNMSQSGAPTPTTPIQPQECGDRTGNLLAADSTSATVNTVTISNDNGKITVTGRSLSEISSTNSAWKNAFTFKLKAGTYYFAGSSSGGVSSYLRNANDDTRISPPNDSFVLSNDTDVYIGFYVYNNNDKTFNVMLNTGSTALPYEPYGVKIPISSAGQTTPVYLGEVETTRKIKKLVFDGTENWTYQSAYTRFVLNLGNAIFLGIRLTPIICTHYITIDDGRSIDDIPNNAIYIGGSAGAAQIAIKTDLYTTAADFKSYLAQQYAAGTPVCIWYVLAEPETGIVNDSLMKIGNYADSISGITIPVTAGGDTLSVDTTVQPSEVTVNYKGWHPVADVHERNSGAWT